jgi:HEAT repeat protein
VLDNLPSDDSSNNQLPPTDASGKKPLEDVFSEFAKADLAKFGVFFRRIRETYPHEVTLACLRYLAARDPDPAGKQMSAWLSTGDSYFSVLFDPDLLSLAEAKRAVAVLRNADRQFFTKLLHLAIENPQGDARLMHRALDLLHTPEDDSVLIPWLRALTRHEDRRIRSKAIKIFGELTCNKESQASANTSVDYLRARMRSEPDDPRVRANAIEALWGVHSSEAVSLFRAALSDSNHRVIANALVGLYYHEAESTLEQMGKLASHSSPLFRAAIAWAFGRIQDPRGAASLQALTEDADPMVRDRAVASLAALPAETAAKTE